MMTSSALDLIDFENCLLYMVNLSISDAWSTTALGAKHGTATCEVVVVGGPRAYGSRHILRFANRQPVARVFAAIERGDVDLIAWVRTRFAPAPYDYAVVFESAGSVLEAAVRSAIKVA
jgi:hypothetical protein